MECKFLSIVMLTLLNSLSFCVLGPQLDYCDLLLFLNNHALKSEIESLKKEKFIAISLGPNCYPALHMMEHDIRIRSFPFDWNVTPFESLCAIINNDFSGFLDLKNLKMNGDMVLNTYYNFKFAHDFDRNDWYDGPGSLLPKDTTGEEDYKKIMTYYQRRIARFYAVFELDVPIYLFRSEISTQQAEY